MGRPVRFAQRVEVVPATSP